MMAQEHRKVWRKYAEKEYDPIKVGSIDGTDTEPHDRAVVRALRSQYAPSKAARGDPARTLFVGRLNPRTTQDTVKNEFAKFGKIVHCRLVKDIVTGKSKQYAFVEFESTSSLEKASKAMDKEFIDNSEVVVEREAGRRLTGWRPRRLGGGFGGRKEAGQLRFGGAARPWKKPIVINTPTSHDKDRNHWEFQGWCKAFTRIETFLTILEAILIIILIALLLFISIHLTVCSEPECNGSCTLPEFQTSVHTTVPPHIKCTWVPSKKTSPYSRYFEHERTLSVTSPASTTGITDTISTTVPIRDIAQYSEESDGEEAEDDTKRYILALVKIRPGRDITFGCICTCVAARWALTAASCLEAIEEVDSLDAFVLLERYGEPRAGRSHALEDVRVHPRYRAPAAAPAAPAAPSAAPAYDVAALRARDALLQALPRADPLLAALVTVGEEYTILGYGRFRTVDSGPDGRRLRRARVWRLPAGQCAGAGGEPGALRHLAHPRPADERPPAGAGAGGVLCAGVLFARGAACHYCAGAPLLRGGRLHALMADSAQCGVDCEPAAYVSLPAIADWLHSVVDG